MGCMWSVRVRVVGLTRRSALPGPLRCSPYIAKTKAPRSWWDRSAGRSGCYVLHANAQTTTCRGTHGAHGGTHGGLGERHGEQGKSAWNEHQGGLCNFCVG